MHGIVLDKLLDNSNFIKKQIVKKVVKEEILYGIKNYKRKMCVMHRNEHNYLTTRKDTDFTQYLQQ